MFYFCNLKSFQKYIILIFILNKFIDNFATIQLQHCSTYVFLIRISTFFKCLNLNYTFKSQFYVYVFIKEMENEHEIDTRQNSNTTHLDIRYLCY